MKFTLLPLARAFTHRPIRLASLLASLRISAPHSTDCSSTDCSMGDLYRTDGIRITHDPYAPGMAEKYGKPGTTDNEGFDPYADSVGAGIYGGIVERDSHGEVVYGKQYQNHNQKPGPSYAGGGYTPINNKLDNLAELEIFLKKYPDLVNGESTGGATPLHMCGMSKMKEKAVQTIVDHGGDVDAMETYGMTPLHRMASNGLAIGAQQLLENGADVDNEGKIRTSALDMAKQSSANNVVKVIEAWKRNLESNLKAVPMIKKVVVENAGIGSLNGEYLGVDAKKRIPEKFAKVCEENRWDVKDMWKKLALGGSSTTIQWYEKSDGLGAYIYYNHGDGQWWLDSDDGLGAYIVPEKKHSSNTNVPGNFWVLHPGKNVDAGKGENGNMMPKVRVYRTSA